MRRPAELFMIHGHGISGERLYLLNILHSICDWAPVQGSRTVAGWSGTALVLWRISGKEFRDWQSWLLPGCGLHVSEEPLAYMQFL